MVGQVSKLLSSSTRYLLIVWIWKCLVYDCKLATLLVQTFATLLCAKNSIVRGWLIE